MHCKNLLLTRWARSNGKRCNASIIQSGKNWIFRGAKSLTRSTAGSFAFLKMHFPRNQRWIINREFRLKADATSGCNQDVCRNKIMMTLKATTYPCVFVVLSNFPRELVILYICLMHVCIYVCSSAKPLYLPSVYRICMHYIIIKRFRSVSV